MSLQSGEEGSSKPRFKRMRPGKVEYECDISLAATAIDNSYVSLIASVASPSRSSTGEVFEKHWLLELSYPGDDILVCEAFKDVAGNLTGHSSWRKRDSMSAVYTYKRFLGHRYLPRSKVDDTMKAICFCGPYDVLQNNCQSWCLRFIQGLNVGLTITEKSAKDIYMEAKRTALPAALLAAALALKTVTKTP